MCHRFVCFSIMYYHSKFLTEYEKLRVWKIKIIMSIIIKFVNLSSVEQQQLIPLFGSKFLQSRNLIIPEILQNFYHPCQKCIHYHKLLSRAAVKRENSYNVAITRLSSVEINYINLIFFINFLMISFHRGRDTIITSILEKT